MENRSDDRAVIKSTDLLCTCMRFDTLQMLEKWQRRFRPIAKRLMAHGKGVNSVRLMETLRLLHLVSLGTSEATAEEHWNKSHHLTKCPCSPRVHPQSTVAFP